MNKKNNKVLLSVVSLMAVLVLMLTACGSANAPSSEAVSTPASAPASSAVVEDDSTVGTKALTVTVVYEDKTSENFEFTTDAEFLRGALEEQNLIAGEESEYGLFVKTVNGVTADDTKEQWWAFTKGGEMLETGVDSTPVADGDAFEITLTIGY